MTMASFRRYSFEACTSSRPGTAPADWLREPAPRIIARHTSKVLPGLFRHIERKDRVTVLEIGPALPETVELFSHFRCRLHFIELYQDEYLREGQVDISEK